MCFYFLHHSNFQIPFPPNSAPSILPPSPSKDVPTSPVAVRRTMSVNGLVSWCSHNNHIVPGWHSHTIKITLKYWGLFISRILATENLYNFFYFTFILFNQVGQLRTSSHLQLRPGQDKVKQCDKNNNTDLYINKQTVKNTI